jgi:hypothetical protein
VANEEQSEGEQPEGEQPERHRPERTAAGMVTAATEDFVNRLGTLAEALRTTGGTAIGGLAGPMPRAVGSALASLQSLVEEVPAPAEQLEILLKEIHAKRAMIAAMQAQLEAFDQQLEVLERSLRPLAEWATQWSHVQGSLVESLRVFRPHGGRRPRGSAVPPE